MGTVSSNSIATPVRELIVSLATPFKMPPIDQTSEYLEGMKTKSMQVVAKNPDLINRSNIPENFIQKDMANGSPSPNNQSPAHDLDSPPQKKEGDGETSKQVPSKPDIPPLPLKRTENTSVEGNKPNSTRFSEERFSGSMQDIIKRTAHRKSFTTMTQKLHFQDIVDKVMKPKINLPKMLVKIQSSEDVTERDERPVSERHSVTTSLRPLPTVRSGLHITVGNIALLFRLTKNMQKKEKFESVEPFNKNLSLMKKIFGLHDVAKSILEFKNTSLSKLGSRRSPRQLLRAQDERAREGRSRKAQVAEPAREHHQRPRAQEVCQHELLHDLPEDRPLRVTRPVRVRDQRDD